jgi:hypothetical protein
MLTKLAAMPVLNVLHKAFFRSFFNVLPGWEG